MVGLFRLGLKARRSNDGQVQLTLEVLSRTNQTDGRNDACVISASGCFTAGCWGTVEFRSEASGLEDFVAKVDIRPPATRPFSLEASQPSSDPTQFIGGGSQTKKLAGVGSLNIHLLMGSGSTMTEVGLGIGTTEQVLPKAIKRLSISHRSGSALGVTSFNKLSAWQRKNPRRTNSDLSLSPENDFVSEGASVGAECGSVASSERGRPAAWAASATVMKLKRGMSGAMMARTQSRIGFARGMSGVQEAPATRSATLAATEGGTSIEIPDHVGNHAMTRPWNFEADSTPATKPQAVSANVMKAIAGLFGRLKLPSRRGLLSTKPALLRSFQAKWVPESWEEIWEAVQFDPSDEIARYMEREFLRDCIVFFNTLFPRQDSMTFQRLRSSALDPHCRGSFKQIRQYTAVKETYCPRIMFLKRLFICFALCGIYCSEFGNEAHLGDLWAYPLASILGHGSRVMVCLEDVDGHDFVHFLLFGRRPSPNATFPLPPLMKRAAATHTVSLDESAKMLKEHRLKVTNTTHALQNIADGFNGKHLGLNLPIGGVGNPSPLGGDYVIGFTGDVLRLRRSSTSIAETLTVDDTRSVLSQEDSDDDNGDDSMTASQRDSEMTISPTTRNPSSRTVGHGDFHTVANMSSGHMYIRVDNFTESTRLCFANSAREEAREEEDLEKKVERGTEDMSRMELTRQHAEAERMAGVLWLSNTMPHLPTWSRARAVAASHAGSDQRGETPFRLVRVRSAPSFESTPMENEELSLKDKRWVQGALSQQEPHTESKRALRTPPSPNALRALLAHYDEASVERFGTGRHKSIEALWEELRLRRSHLVKHKGSLWRFVEPLVLQLRWHDYMLVQTAEQAPDSKHFREKNTFVTTRMKPGESWNEAVHRVVQSKLNLNPADFWASLTERHPWENQYTLIEEDSVSPSYPGIMTFYRTHLVKYTIGDEFLDLYRGCGLPVVDPVKRLSRRRSCLATSSQSTSQFVTTQHVGSGCRTMYWRWVSVFEAQHIPRFINMPSHTPAERWARYAFTHEGVVQSPPSIEALASLLLRCGVDLSKFGSDDDDHAEVQFSRQTRSLQSLFTELTVEQRYLRMSGGRPFRVAEPMYIRVRWRLPRGNVDGPLVLVQNEHEKRIIRTTKPAAEDWYKAAIRALSENLQVSQAQVRSALSHRPSDSSCYSSYEERKDSLLYPGIPTLYRTHLVTYDLKEDPGPAFISLAFLAQTNYSADLEPLPNRNPSSRFTLNWRSPSVKSRSSAFPDSPVVRSSSESPKVDKSSSRREAASPLARRSAGSSPSRQLANALMTKKGSDAFKSPKSTTGLPMLFTREKTTSIGSGSRDMQQFCNGTGSDMLTASGFCWVPEAEAIEEDVRGLRLFTQAAKLQSRHSISSVLLGLEGSAPMCSSPHGTKHDASGASSAISATGGAKWREYRNHHALQVPADIGGMRMYITREQFEEFKKACELLDLSNPADDLLPRTTRSREELQRRYEEQELFKSLLSCPGHKAKQAVHWMIQHRRLCPTVNQIASRFSPFII